MQTYLIDASIYVFRAWFTIPDDMLDAEQQPVNAVYGFTRFLGDFLERVDPDHVAAAFDVSLTSSFRNDLYPDYKANREPAPPELKRQFQMCREITAALGVRSCADTRYEADDLIGTLAAGNRRDGQRVTIVSRDKDMLQLLQDGDAMWDLTGGKRVRHDQVGDALGVRAEQVIDYLGLAGDSVDNIPGVPGVGPKTASRLLEHFDSLEHLYADLERVAELPLRGAAKLGAKLTQHREQAELSRELARIHCDVPMPMDKASVARGAPEIDTLNALYDAAGFGEGLRRQAQRIAERYQR
ncbi:MAG: flap endonuclease [Chromatiales bacterium]|nr:MAG: flap endonuclease [Chromatiales bacterium]